MIETETAKDALTQMPSAKAKSDGKAGQPFSVPSKNTEGAPNAALKEPPAPKGDGYNPDHPQSAKLIVLDRELALIGTKDGSPMRKRIAICGFASSTRGYMAHVTDDSEWELWALNQLARHMPSGPSGNGGRIDRHFDIHYNWDQEIVPGTDHRAWARDCGIPFYMLKPEPDIPTAVRFPINTLLSHFRADYFTSTISYMVALAIYEIDLRVAAELNALVMKQAPNAAKGQMIDVAATQQALYADYTIGVFGVDLTVGGEYFDEKPCAEFWLGQAVGRNIDVRIPRESALCKHAARYGYEKEPNQIVKLGEFEAHQVKLRAERDELFKRLMMLEGAMECDELWRQTIELRLRGTQVGGK